MLISSDYLFSNPFSMVIKHVAYLLRLIFYRDLGKAAAAVVLHVNVFLVILLSRGVSPEMPMLRNHLEQRSH